MILCYYIPLCRLISHECWSLITVYELWELLYLANFEHLLSSLTMLYIIYWQVSPLQIYRFFSNSFRYLEFCLLYLNILTLNSDFLSLNHKCHCSWFEIACNLNAGTLAYRRYNVVFLFWISYLLFLIQYPKKATWYFG